MTEFITRNYGQKEFEVIIKTDNKEHYKATQDFARKLIDHAKPQTNADRIRAMSDEELANWLARTQMGAIKDAMAILQFPCDATDEIVELGTRESLLWLKQPADMRGEEDG